MWYCIAYTVNSVKCATSSPMDQWEECSVIYIRKWIYHFPHHSEEKSCQILFLFSVCFLSDALAFLNILWKSHFKDYIKMLVSVQANPTALTPTLSEFLDLIPVCLWVRWVGKGVSHAWPQAILKHHSENSTQVWHYLPRDSTTFPRLRAQSHKTALHSPDSRCQMLARGSCLCFRPTCYTLEVSTTSSLGWTNLHE